MAGELMVRSLCVATVRLRTRSVAGKAASGGVCSIDNGTKNFSELLQEKFHHTNSSCASDSPIKVPTGLETVSLSG
jgi:hypothetical protein